MTRLTTLRPASETELVLRFDAGGVLRKFTLRRADPP